MVKRWSIDPDGIYSCNEKMRAHARGEPVTLNVLQLVEWALKAQPLSEAEQRHLRLKGFPEGLGAKWLADTCGYQERYFEERFYYYRSGLSPNSKEKLAHLTNTDKDFWYKKEYTPEDAQRLRFDLDKDAQLVAVPSNILKARLSERAAKEEQALRDAEPEFSFDEERTRYGTLREPSKGKGKGED